MNTIDTSVLSPIIDNLFRHGRGILAADESMHTIKKRFDTIDLANTFENRRIFRDILIATDNIEDYISGVILYPETLFQSSISGKPFSEVLKDKKIVIGVKVDLGTYDMPGFEGDFLTAGIDGLRDRLKEYKSEGAQFTKFRCVFSIAEGLPTMESVHTNSLTMALYARIVQEEGMIPIVEPEVLYDGNHTIEESHRITEWVIDYLFYQMKRMRVDIPHVVLKTSMVLAGKQYPKQSEPEEVAEHTMQTLLSSVPHDVKGVVFLSGGQTVEQSLMNFDAIADRGPFPFNVTFSFARTLQSAPLKVWNGEEKKIPYARNVFIDILKNTCSASQGRYILR